MNVVTKNIEGFPGAMVWQDPDDEQVFYLTNSRGKNRSTHQLDARTLDEAIKVATDWLK